MTKQEVAEVLDDPNLRSYIERETLSEIVGSIANADDRTQINGMTISIKKSESTNTSSPTKA